MKVRGLIQAAGVPGDWCKKRGKYIDIYTEV
jgi:hypothetical protein